MVALLEPAVVDKATTLETLLQTPAGKRMMTCIQCGTCAGTCPYGEYMDFSPRRVINMLRGGFIDEVIKSDSLLRCVACYACMAKCPRGIRLTDVLLPLVKEQVLVNRTEMPAEFQKSLENMNRYGNPMGESPRKRAAWTATAGHEDPDHGRSEARGGRAVVCRVLHLLLRRAARTTAAPPPSCSTRWAWISPSWATRRSAPAIAGS